MTNRETMELFIEKNGQETVAYPFVEKDHVVFGNGMGIEEVIEQDVSMPTVTHEEVSFKVGVGDQDVSSSIVDSSVGEMVIKGQTYQNILPEPSTHILTNDKEMFKVNEGLDSSVEIVDGVAKSAILKGLTLVNLYPNINREPSKFSVGYGITVDDDNWVHIANLEGQHQAVVYKDISLFKPNTTYTFIVEVKNNTLDRGLNLFQDYQNGIIQSSATIEVGFNGTKKILVTTVSDFTDKIKVMQTHKWYTVSGEIDYRITIIEGDYTNVDIPYFTGMQSVKMPVLTTTGKNQWIEQDFMKHTSNSSVLTNTDNGFIVEHPNQISEFIKTYINLKKGTWTISFDVEKTDTSPAWVFLQKEDVYGENITKNVSIQNGRFSITYTSSSDIENACLFFDLRHQGTLTISNIQLEQGSAATSYEPFKSNVLMVNEDVTLRSNGDIYDELNLLTGQLTQRIDENNEVLAQEVVKTVDLSSSGNWEKVVLDGSEDWAMLSSGVSRSKTTLFSSRVVPEGDNKYHFNNRNLNIADVWMRDVEAVQIANAIDFRYSVDKTRLMTDDVAGFKAFLKENPLTIWYKTETHKDSTQVKQPIFFKDGHIRLSSGADNSLIPTLDYQAKTSNSYVMDLIKTNTKYTMKAKSASGTFTIDGTSYGAGTNGTFTTPSSMTNKFLVMSNNANEEIMILEGDVTDKTIPYFKGIKSAFEDEDKIEVLSTGKNVTHIIVGGDLDSQEYNFMNILEQDKNTSAALNRAKVIKWVGDDKFFVKGYGINQYDNQYNIDFNPSVLKPNTTYYISFESIEGSHETNPSLKLGLDSFNVWLNGTRVLRVYSGGTYSFTTPSQINGFSFNIWLSGTKDKNAIIYAIFNKFMMEEGESYNKEYEPHKSNSTKIPLLSPLRSLPNGVCDELIIDRMKKKATLVQRVDKIVFDGKQKWLLWNNNPADVVSGYVYYDPNNMGYEPKSYGYTINDRLPHNSGGHMAIVEGARYTNYFTASLHKSRIGVISVNDTTTNTRMVQRWYIENPMTMYYELETPVVTEVDLEGFPYIYKDGHIFLNSEIAPTTQIIYSISQQHQISASTQDLIRHEQELVYLYKLIAQYIQVDYQSTLLSLDLKLK